MLEDELLAPSRAFAAQVKDLVESLKVDPEAIAREMQRSTHLTAAFRSLLEIRNSLQPAADALAEEGTVSAEAFHLIHDNYLRTIEALLSLVRLALLSDSTATKTSLIAAQAQADRDATGGLTQ